MKNTPEKNQNLDIVEFISKKIAEMVAALAKKNNIDNYADSVAKRFNETIGEQYHNILTKVINDAKSVDFLNGLESGQIHQLVKSTFSVSLAYECMVYARQLLVDCGYSVPEITRTSAEI